MSTASPRPNMTITRSEQTKTSIARRSVSIFSRKGDESPEGAHASIAQATMRGFTMPPTKQKSWKLGKAMSVKSTASRSSTTNLQRTGTILNAVPPAKKIHMSRLSEEMATSPNDEILTAIRESPTADAPNGSGNVLPTDRTISKRRSSPALSARARSQKRRDGINNRVGVWVDGVVHWDPAVLAEESNEIDHFTQVRPMTAGDKPQLSVVIPGGAPLISDRTMSQILRRQPQPRVVRETPISLASRFAITPSESVETRISPVRLESEQPPELPPRQSLADVHIYEEKQVASRLSTSSSSGGADSGSSYSRRSSATSVYSVPSADLEVKDKPLPALPATQPQSQPQYVGTSNPIYHPYRPSKSMRAPAYPNHLQYTQLIHSHSISELDSRERKFTRVAPYARYVRGPSPTLSQAEEELRDRLETMSPRTTEEPKELEDTSISRASGLVRRKSSVKDVMEPPARAPSIPKRSRKRDWRATGASKNAYLPPPEVPRRRKSDSQMKQQLASGENAKGSLSRKSLSVYARRQLSDDATSRAEQARSKAAGEYGTRARADSASFGVSESTLTVAEAADKSWLEIEPESAAEEKNTVPDTILESDESAACVVPSASAENVLLCILSALHSTQDLFNTAIINKGMYRVYKENEMELIRTVSYTASAPAWELREWSPPQKNDVRTDKASSLLEHSPLSYLRCYRRDAAVIECLKWLILDRCQTFIRRETAFALSTPSHPDASRYNDAFWRIWCFCQIFGCDKNREDDVTGQLDWLKGGILANNRGCVATVNTNLDFDMASVLLNAPDYFSKANLGGLNASQLFDMTEIWTCLKTLLHGYVGRVDQARTHGVFDTLDIAEGDIAKEEHALEEWIAYILTLGPAVVLEMAERATDPQPTGFALAQNNGWTHWSPPSSGSGTRTTFLREPVSKSYEEQALSASLRHQDPVELELKERSRQRVATLAAEIRLRRQSSDYKRLPLIDMKAERAMSVVSRRGSAASSRKSSAQQHPGSRRSASSSSSSIYSVSSASIYSTSSSIYSTSTSSATSSVYPLWEPQKNQISPIVEEGAHHHRLELHHFAPATNDDSAERALKRIVAMGWPVSEAREALSGSGFDLDAAVELLLGGERLKKSVPPVVVAGERKVMPQERRSSHAIIGMGGA